MSRSFTYLRRALFGTSCAIVFGFGATQALAAPGQPARIGTCVYGDPGARAYCSSLCVAEKLGTYGFCSRMGICACGGSLSGTR